MINTNIIFCLLLNYYMYFVLDICEYNLSGRLTVSNCLDYLVLGEMYRAQHLKETSMMFLVENIKAVMKTEEWVEMEKKYPSLVIEVMKAAINKTAD